MSFLINFYTNKSDNINLNKDLTQLGRLVFNDFRGDFDVFNPLLIIQTDDDSTVKDINYNYYTTFAEDIRSGKINYFEIPSVNRYYYSVSYRMVHNNVIAIKLHEDVLKTRSSLIRSCEGIIRRNENFYNLYINDKAINTYAKPFIRRKYFSANKSFTTSNPSSFLITTGIKASPIGESSLFSITVNRNSSTSAQNGGACVFIPYAQELTSYCTNSSYFEKFTNDIVSTGNTSNVGGYVICPMSAVYGPYYADNNRIYIDEKFCIAQVIKARQDEDNPLVYNLELSIIKTFDYGTTLNYRSVISATDFAGEAKASVWSIGGQVDWAIQNTGAVVAVNGIYPPVATTIQFASSVNINPTGNNTLLFNTYW